MATEPTGILGVVQTPFTTENEIDARSFSRLVEDALDAGVVIDYVLELESTL